MIDILYKESKDIFSTIIFLQPSSYFTPYFLNAENHLLVPLNIILVPAQILNSMFQTPENPRSFEDLLKSLEDLEKRLLAKNVSKGFCRFVSPPSPFTRSFTCLFTCKACKIHFPKYDTNTWALYQYRTSP